VVFAVVLSPNVIWNAQHGFATLHHTAANANWGHGFPFKPAHLGQFLVSQFGIFGPIPFGALIAGVAIAARRRSLAREDLLLLCFVLPPLAIVSVQALLSRANANWSGASYLAGAVLVAGWLVRWRARRWLMAAVAIEAVVAAFVLVVAVQPRVADAIGASNSLKRVRGWRATVQMITDRASAEGAGRLTAIAVNDRFLFYAMSYYGRGYLRQAGSPPLSYWLLTGEPANQAETNAPLTPALGGRVLAVSYKSRYVKAMMDDFARTSRRELDTVWLDRKHTRKLEMFIGEGFAPKPRDPVTGRPTPP
jgi:hypothetical protein